MLSNLISSLSSKKAALKEVENVKSVLDQLSLEQTVDLMTKQTDEMAYYLFWSLDKDKQDHILPLLSQETIEDIMNEVKDEERKAELQLQLDCFQEHAERMEEDPSCSGSFFYLMAVHNALKCRIEDKLSYFITADKLQSFDLKPYKYQRKLMEKHVQTIAEGINRSGMLYHPIILCYISSRDSLTIFDGQHRWNALKRLEDPQLVTVQVDVILCEDDDEQAMQIYKNINTNVPIDHNTIKEELKYIALVEKIRASFGPKVIRNFNKELKDVPQHFVVDSMMKEELQYRNMLASYKPEQIIEGLYVVNQMLTSEPHLELSLIDSKICRREGMYLGVKWPQSIDRLEQYLSRNN